MGQIVKVMTIILLVEVYGLIQFQSTKDFNQTFKKPRENCGLVMDVPVRSVGVKKAVQKEWVGSAGHGSHRAIKIINKTNQFNQTSYFVDLLRIACFAYMLIFLGRLRAFLRHYPKIHGSFAASSWVLISGWFIHLYPKGV